MATEAIYIDANPLIAGTGIGTLKIEAAKLDVGIFVPEIAVREFVEARLRDTKRCLDKIHECNRELNRLMGHETNRDADFAELKEPVKLRALEFVKSNELCFIPTPRDMDVLDLINRAVKHEVPFKEKGRGFKDAVILETVKSHMKEHGISEAILLTSDGDFTGVPDRLHREGLNLIICAKVEDVISKLNEEADEADQEWRRRKEAEIGFCLKSHLSELSMYIKNHAEIDEWIITGRHPLFPKSTEDTLSAGLSVDKILDCKVQGVGDVMYLPGASTDAGNEFVDAAWINVDTEFDVVVSGYVYDSLFFGKRFIPTAEGKHKSISDPTRTSFCREEKTFLRKVPLTVRLTGTNDDGYKCLEFDPDLS